MKRTILVKIYRCPQGKLTARVVSWKYLWWIYHQYFFLFFPSPWLKWCNVKHHIGNIRTGGFGENHHICLSQKLNCSRCKSEMRENENYKSNKNSAPNHCLSRHLKKYLHGMKNTVLLKFRLIEMQKPFLQSDQDQFAKTMKRLMGSRVWHGRHYFKTNARE